MISCTSNNYLLTHRWNIAKYNKFYSPSFDTIRPKSTAFRQISTENERQSCFKAEKGYTSAKVPFVPSAC